MPYGKTREEPPLLLGHYELDLRSEGLVSCSGDQAIRLEERIRFHDPLGKCSPSPKIVGRDAPYGEDPSVHDGVGSGLNLRRVGNATRQDEATEVTRSTCKARDATTMLPAVAFDTFPPDSASTRNVSIKTISDQLYNKNRLGLTRETAIGKSPRGPHGSAGRGAGALGAGGSLIRRAGQR